MECSKIQESLTAYIANEVMPEEKAMIEQHLKQCPICRALEAQLRKTWEIAGNWETKEPSEELVSRLYKKIKSLPQPQKNQRPFLPSPPYWFKVAGGLAVAAAILIVVIIAFPTKQPIENKESITTEKPVEKPQEVKKPSETKNPIETLINLLPSMQQAFADEAIVKKGNFTITVYNDNLAMVKDSSIITNLKKGLNIVRFHGVASGIKPDSVSFKSLTDQLTTQVLEQNYEYDLVSAGKALGKYIDNDIKILMDDGKTRAGKLVSFESNLSEMNVRINEYRVTGKGQGTITITDEDGKLEVIPFNSVREIKLGKLPPNMVTKPTLVWELDVRNPGEHQVEVGYLTEGMFWDADYVAIVAPDDKSIDFKGWVTLRNNSGNTFPDASLKLIAGDVNVIKPPPPQKKEEAKRGFQAVSPGESDKEKNIGFVEKTFFEYHMYTLQGKTTLRDNEVKQITLFPELKKIPVKKIFLYNGSKFGKKVRNILEFENIKENNMGIPLPKGRIKVSKADIDGLLEHIGQDTIDHTPAGKKEFIRIFLGNAFDVAGEWKQTNTKHLGDNTYEYSYEIKLRNHMDSLRSPQADKEVEVVVQEDHLYGSWEIIENSHKYEKKNANTIEFTIKVPEKGKEVVVTYTVRITL